MEYIRMAIVTDDRAYGEAVCRSLLIGNRGFDLSLYTCAGFCESWQAGGLPFRRSFDMILWDSDAAGEICRDSIVWLAERAGDVDYQQRPVRETAASGAQSGADEQAGAERRFAVYKYSSSKEMIGAVFRIYAALTGRQPAGRRPDRVDVFAFASWQGGCGCTTLAMALGQELTRFYGRRVLYLSMEGIESSASYMEPAPGLRTAAEYLYHLSAGNADGGRFLEEYLAGDPYGMKAFSPAASCNPLHTAGREEIRRLLSSLMDSGRFDTVLIDAGTGTGEAQREALSWADRICLVSVRDEPIREAGYRSFLKHGTGCGQAVLRIHNRRTEQGGTAGGTGAGGRTGTWTEAMAGSSAGSSAETGTEAALIISERTGAGHPLLLEGSFGKDIHMLAELCYNNRVKPQ